MEERFAAFTVLIAKINRNIRRIKTEEMAEFHLKGPHVACLYHLTTAGPLTAGELCDRCDEDKAAISRSLDFLEKEGYLVCDSSARKRYRSPLRLTEKGEATGRRIMEKIDRIVREATLRAQNREEEILRKASAEADAIRDKAIADIAQEKKKAVNDAKNEISGLAMAIAGKVVERELTDDDQSALIDRFIQDLGDPS